MKYVLALVAALLLTGHAIAQHGHGAKGPSGGQMEDVVGVVAELVASGNTLTVHVYDEASKPVPTKGFTASALVVTAGAQETVTLTPSGENTLQVTTKTAIGAGTSITVMLRTAVGKTGQARYRQ